jgi:serine/threonine protein kinase
MSDWNKHTSLLLPIGDYEQQWEEALLKTKDWPIWGSVAPGRIEKVVTERYTDDLLQPLGWGSFGIVFKGQRRDTGETVAVKAFPYALVKQAPPNKVERVLAPLMELRTLAFVAELGACQRGNVICLVDHFRAKLGRPFVRSVSEFLGKNNYTVSMAFPPFDGQTSFRDPEAVRFFIETRFVPDNVTMYDLYKKLGRNGSTFSFQANVNIMLSAVRALEFLHTVEMAHGDIKPENLLVVNTDTELPSVILIDLGLACRVASNVQEKVNLLYGTCQKISGSVAYLAPEQMRANDSPSTDTVNLPFATRAAWDVYSLGLTFYDFGTGKDAVRRLLPYEYQYEEPPTRLDAESRLPHEPYFPSVPGDQYRVLNAFVHSMVAYNPERRAKIRSLSTTLAVTQKGILPPLTGTKRSDDESSSSSSSSDSGSYQRTPPRASFTSTVIEEE